MTENAAGNGEAQQEIERNYRWNFTVNVLDGASFWFGSSFISSTIILPLYVSHYTQNPLWIGLIPFITTAGFLLPQLFIANAVEILTNPKITKEVVQQCVDLGIQRVWMHCLMGTKPGLAASMTSVSPDAVRLCRENGITVIPGACPNQFLKPDFGHSLMRVMFRTFGFHSIKED